MSSSASSTPSTSSPSSEACKTREVCECRLEFWDPHFHIWDARPATAAFASGVDPAILAGGTPTEDKNYTYSRLLQSLEALRDGSTPLQYSGGCFIEAMSVCHPDTKNGADLNVNCVQEAKWVERNLPRNYYSCPSIQLQEDNADQALSEIVKCHHVRGVRQILNYRAPPSEASAPRCKEDMLANESFRANFALLEKHDLHFECQLESPQYEGAYSLFSEHPLVPIVINHLGSPDLADLARDDTAFWVGMSKFATLPQVSIKLSMICRIQHDWPTNPIIIAAVHKIIDLFGVRRCFFASNFPVDEAMGWGAKPLFKEYLKIASEYGRTDQQALFATNARRIYRASQFTSSDQTMEVNAAAVAANDVDSLVDCFSRNAQLTVINKETLKVVQVASGHTEIRRFYRDKLIPSNKSSVTVLSNSVQAVATFTTDKSMDLETSTFEPTSHRISSRVVLTAP